MAESELFGYERGAFTGAVATKRGLLELANGGTLFLNEIGELCLRLQAKLLHFLDYRKITRVGGEGEISVNARLLAATNRDLEKDIEAGSFRRYLYYRIKVTSIRVPPLRERREDIPILVAKFMQKIRNDFGLKDVPYVSPQTMAALQQYDWPGNVRELSNVLESAVTSSGGRELIVDEKLLRPAPKRTPFWILDSFPPKPSLEQVVADLRDRCMREAERQTGNNKKRAAELLGVSRFKVIRHRKKKDS